MSRLTLPGVLDFLREEWQKNERTRIEWDLERAEMRNRIVHLEAEKAELERERDRIQRHFDILKNSRIFGKNGSVSSSSSSGSGSASNNDDIHTTESDQTESSALQRSDDSAHQNDVIVSHTQRQSEELKRTIAQSLTFLQECSVEMRDWLMLPAYSDPYREIEDYYDISDYLAPVRSLTYTIQEGLLSVAALPEDRVVSCHLSSESANQLLLWQGNSPLPQPFGSSDIERPLQVLYLRSSDRVVVRSADKLAVYTIADRPELVTSLALPECQNAAVPDEGNLIAVVHANQLTVYSLQSEGSLVQLSEFKGTQLRSCAFGDVAGDLNLAVCEQSSGVGAAVVLLDPLTGLTLRRIYLERSAVWLHSLLLHKGTLVLGIDGQVCAYDLAQDAPPEVHEYGSTSSVTSLMACPSSDRLRFVSTGLDGRVIEWTFDQNRLMFSRRLLNHDRNLGVIGSSVLENRLVVGGSDGVMRIYHLD